MTHPKGFWILFLILATVMFGVAYLQGSVILHLRNYFHAADVNAYQTYAVYGGILYLTGVLGGVLSGRWISASGSILLGIFCLMLGMLLIAAPREAAFYIGLVIFIQGYGLVYPNAFFLLGKLYALEDSRRESGFTLAYTGLNVGAVLGFILAGYSVENGSADFEWISIGSGLLLLGMFIFLIINRARFSEKNAGATNWLRILLTLFAFSILCILTLQFAAATQRWLCLVSFIALLSFFWMAYREKRTSKKAARKMLLLGLLGWVTVVFWSFYKLQDSLILVFIDQHVNRIVLGKLISSPSILGLNPFFILIIGPILSRLLPELSKKLKITPVSKIFSGIFLMGIAFLCLLFGVIYGEPVGMTWIITFFFFLSAAEIILAPSTFSMVGRYVDEKYQAFFLGILRSTFAISTLFAGGISAFVSERNTQAIHPAQYAHIYLAVAFILFVVSLLFYVFRRLNLRWS